MYAIKFLLCYGHFSALSSLVQKNSERVYNNEICFNAIRHESVLVSRKLFD